MQDLEAQSLDGVLLLPLYSGDWCWFLQSDLALLHWLTSSALFQQETRCSNLSSSSSTQCPHLYFLVRSSLSFIRYVLFKNIVKKCNQLFMPAMSLTFFRAEKNLNWDFWIFGYLIKKDGSFTKAERIFFRPIKQQGDKCSINDQIFLNPKRSLSISILQITRKFSAEDFSFHGTRHFVQSWWNSQLPGCLARSLLSLHTQ